jgi:hypothetical protein
VRIDVISQRPWRLVIGALLSVALVAAVFVTLRSTAVDVTPSTSPNFPLRGDLVGDQSLLDQAAREWSHGTGKARDEKRIEGEVSALWAGTVSTHQLDGISVPSTAGAKADLVVLSDARNVASLVRFRDGADSGFHLYGSSVRAVGLPVSLDIGPGFALLAADKAVADKGLACAAHSQAWHPVGTQLHEGLFQRADDGRVSVRVVDEGVLLLEKSSSSFYQTPQGNGDKDSTGTKDSKGTKDTKDREWAALSDPRRAEGARAAVLEAGGTQVKPWTDRSEVRAATWLADVKLSGGIRGSVFAVGSPDVRAFAVVAAGLSWPGGEEATPVPLGTHTQGYAAAGTAASMPPLAAAWVRIGPGKPQLLVVGDETVVSLEIRVGTKQTKVSGHVAVLDPPSRTAWVTTGKPLDRELPRYTVVGRTAEGWAVPLDDLDDQDD